MGAGAAPANSGEPAALPAGEGCREACMLTLGRFVLNVGVEGRPTAAHDGDRRRRPRWLKLRREGRTGWAISGF
jgi:hypothetical protein